MTDNLSDLEPIPRNKLPDFLIIGAGKSGTTSLDQYLGQHPEIFMSPVKEPNFFAYYHHHEEDFKIEESRLHFLESIRDINAYTALFEGATNGQLKGETSNTYLYGEHSLKAIQEFVPDAKFIAIFRQPAERLYSRYLHLARENMLPTQNFEDCLDTSSIWWRRPDLIQEGFYFRHLERFYRHFKAENIKVFLFEDLKNPEFLFPELFNFLGVNPEFRPSDQTVYNQSGFVKNRLKNALIGPNGLLIKAVKKLAPSALQKLKSSRFLNRKLNNVRASNLSKPKLDRDFKIKLTKEVYLDDIKQLESLIGRDLSSWYEFKEVHKTSR